MKFSRTNVMLLGLLTTLVFGCGKSSDTKKVNLISSNIINGTTATSSDITTKSVVGIIKNYRLGDSENDGDWVAACTGTILNKKMILTAAHCLKDSLDNDESVNRIRVNFSLNSIDFNMPIVKDIKTIKNLNIKKIKSFILNSEYDKTAVNDIAIILLEDEIPDGFTPINLPPENFLKKDPKTKYELTLYGYGMLSQAKSGLLSKFSKDTYSANLKMTKMKGRFEYPLLVTDSGACHGDSGGPAFLSIQGSTYQVGIVSGPHKLAKTCASEVDFVDLTLHKKFLEEAQDQLLND